MSIRTLLLAGVLSLAAGSAAYATEGPPTTASDKNGHASAAPACGYECPVLATDGPPGSADDKNGRSGACVAGDGGPGNPGDHNGRAELAIDIHSMMAGGKPVGSDFHGSAAPACGDGCAVLADDVPPIGAGDDNGRSSAALSQGGGKFRVAGGGKVGSDFGQ